MRYSPYNLSSTSNDSNNNRVIKIFRLLLGIAVCAITFIRLAASVTDASKQVGSISHGNAKNNLSAFICGLGQTEHNDVRSSVCNFCIDCAVSLDKTTISRWILRRSHKSPTTSGKIVILTYFQHMIPDSPNKYECE